MNSTRFGLDLKKYNGVEKKTKTVVYIITVKELKEY